MDFIDGLPRSDNQTSIMVVVDRMSKSAHLLPLSHPYTTRSVAEKFIKSIVKLHGIPRTIVNDRDPVFVRVFLAGLVVFLGYKSANVFSLSHRK